MQLHEFLDRFRDAITRAVVASYPPLYDLTERRSGHFTLGRLGRRPLGGQADAIRAAALSLQRQPSTVIVGEMGTGKSFVSAAAAYLAGCRRILVICPPHLVRKWEREVRLAVPGAHVAIVRRIEDLERIRRHGRAYAPTPGAGASAPPTFAILSREQAKLGYRWRPAVAERLVIPRDGGGIPRDERGAPLRVPCCPRCGTPVVDGDGIPLTRADLERKKVRCNAPLTGRHARRPEKLDRRKSGPHDRCNAPLWTADRTGPRRYPLADYIRTRMRGHFDLVIADEAHEFKARGSAQGIALAALVGATGRSLACTGTLLGGYASSIFALLYRVDPAVRREFGFGDELRWVQRYGIVERITSKEGGEEDYAEDGRNTKRRAYRTRTIERPGISPAILFNLIGSTVFLRLADVATDLPGYEERVVLFDLDDAEIPPAAGGEARTGSGGHGDEPGATSQARAYRALARDLRAAVLDALQSGSKRLLGAYLQSLLAYPDGCTREEIVVDRGDGASAPRVIASAPALPGDRLYPKERALVELALRERGRGRRLLVYVGHTETRDLTPRLREILEGAGLRTAVLKSHTVAADRREEWVAARVREGLDALIVNPRIVQTGLDLLDFASIAWFQLDYSTYVMRQASRRSWRIGQRADVAVYFFTYRGTLQAEALQLVKQKVRASLLIEGELPEGGWPPRTGRTRTRCSPSPGGWSGRATGTRGQPTTTPWRRSSRRPGGWRPRPATRWSTSPTTRPSPRRSRPISTNSPCRPGRRPRPPLPRRVPRSTASRRRGWSFPRPTRP